MRIPSTQRNKGPFYDLQYLRIIYSQLLHMSLRNHPKLAWDSIKVRSGI